MEKHSSPPFAFSRAGFTVPVSNCGAQRCQKPIPHRHGVRKAIVFAYLDPDEVVELVGRDGINFDGRDPGVDFPGSHP